MSKMSRCWKLGTNLFLGFALAALALCPEASAQRRSCDSTGGAQPCIQKFVDPLAYPPFFAPNPVTVGGNPGDGYQIAGREILQPVLSCSNPSRPTFGACNAQLPTTAVFAYGTNGFPYSNSAATKVCNADGTDTANGFDDTISGGRI
jgi:hypothetical protein